MAKTAKQSPPLHGHPPPLHGHSHCGCVGRIHVGVACKAARYICVVEASGEMDPRLHRIVGGVHKFADRTEECISRRTLAARDGRVRLEAGFECDR